MLNQLICRKCNCERTFFEKDGIFTCQVCGTQYPTDYIVAEIKQKIARDIGRFIFPATEDDIAIAVHSCVQSAWSSFVNSNFKETERLCDEVIKSGEENYAAWLLKGEAICFQLALPAFDFSDSIDKESITNTYFGPSTSSVKVLASSIIPLQSALFNIRFDKAIDDFIKAINAAPAEMMDGICLIALNTTYNEVLSACLQMLTSLSEAPIPENCSAYSTEKVHLATKALMVSDAAYSKYLKSEKNNARKNEYRHFLTWETCAQWLSRNELSTAIKIWETEIAHYKTGHDVHPSKEAVTRLSNALCTATLMVDLFLLSDPLEDLNIYELNFSMRACNKAIAMCQEAKRLKCYQSTSDNDEQTPLIDFDFLDERINRLKIARERVINAIKEQSSC